MVFLFPVGHFQGDSQFQLPAGRPVVGSSLIC